MIKGRDCQNIFLKLSYYMLYKKDLSQILGHEWIESKTM